MAATNNLVIGSSSQLSQYMPRNYQYCRCSSYLHDAIHSFLVRRKWDKVYLCFAEQRTFLDKSIKESFFSTNTEKTLRIIDQYSDQVDKFVVFSTVGLWNKYEGKYNIDTPFSFDGSAYLRSKEELTKKVIDNEKVITLFPCNFNSKYRRPGFLFHKLILAIIADQKCKVGNLDFCREIAHAKYISERVIHANTNQIISPGLLVNIKQYFTDVLEHFGKKYSDYFIETDKKTQSYLDNVYKHLDSTYTYEKLVEQTVEDFG